MLRSLNYLEQYMVIATDGDVGNVVDFLLDDEYWFIRYLVVDTGAFLNRHDVLISPISFSEVEGPIQRFHVNLTKEKVKSSPTVDTHKPVSRQQEEELHNYYGYPPYWGDDNLGMIGSMALPSLAAVGDGREFIPPRVHQLGDIHLRSAKEVRGYDIQASDESIGHVDDYIVDDDIWEIRYLVIDTSNWWFGKRVLVAPRWASRIDWEQRSVHVDMSRQAIKDSPLYDSSVTLNREYETRLHGHYGEQGYWNKSDRHQKPRPTSGTPLP
jgi:uncharacterized protein YifN (PemK superfamily)